MDKKIALLKALYLVPNTYQLWAWGLTVLFVLFCIKPTRRFGGIGFGVGLCCMFIYMAVLGTMKDFAPKDYSQDAAKAKTKQRAARPW